MEVAEQYLRVLPRDLLSAGICNNLHGHLTLSLQLIC